jgi:hypothetical protein
MSSSSITVQIYRVGHTIAKLKKEKNKVSVNLQLLELRLQRQIRECFNDMIYISALGFLKLRFLISTR